MQIYSCDRSSHVHVGSCVYIVVLLDPDLPLPVLQLHLDNVSLQLQLSSYCTRVLAGLQMYWINARRAVLLAPHRPPLTAPRTTAGEGAGQRRL